MSSRMIVLVLMVVVVFSACATPPQEVSEREYVWPLPPEKPRIRYVKSIWGEDDVRQAAPTDFIVGKDPSTDLFKPYGVGTDHSGRLYVTDTIRRVVFVFDEVMGDLSFIGLKGMPLGVPADVVVDSMDRIYVSDSARDEIFVFDRNDRVINRFGRGIVDNPAGMVFDEGRGRLYVVSSKTHRVEVFSPAGKHLFGFGGFGCIRGGELLRKPRPVNRSG